MLNRTHFQIPSLTTPAVAQSPGNPSGSNGVSFRQVFEQMGNHWDSANRKLASQEKSLPDGIRDLVSLQRGMQQAGFESQLVTSVADSANQSLKKLQQVGAS